MGITVSRPIRPPASDVLVKHQVEYGLHFINLEAAPFTRWEEAIKRGVDMLLAAALICALLPLLALVASLIRLTSNGPVFYRSRRVRFGGQHFTFWKFRTMYVNAARRRDLAGRNECSGHLFKLRSDPRVTPVGRVLRRLSLDELPQLFNVLTGDMSLVGPRPLPIEDLEPDGMSRTPRQVGGGAVARTSWHHGSLAGARAQRPSIQQHGGTGYGIHPELVDPSRPVHPMRDATGGGVGAGGLLRGIQP